MTAPGFTPGLKRTDFQPCAYCGKGVGHAGVHFYRITATLHVFDDAAIRRADGFERALGSPVLAHVLGPDEPLSAAAHTTTRLICGDCGLSPQVLAVLLED